MVKPRSRGGGGSIPPTPTMSKPFWCSLPIVGRHLCKDDVLADAGLYSLQVPEGLDARMELNVPIIADGTVRRMNVSVRELSKVRGDAEDTDRALRDWVDSVVSAGFATRGELSESDINTMLRGGDVPFTRNGPFTRNPEIADPSLSLAPYLPVGSGQMDDPAAPSADPAAWYPRYDKTDRGLVRLTPLSLNVNRLPPDAMRSMIETGYNRIRNALRSVNAGPQFHPGVALLGRYIRPDVRYNDVYGVIGRLISEWRTENNDGRYFNRPTAFLASLPTGPEGVTGGFRYGESQYQWLWDRANRFRYTLCATPGYGGTVSDDDAWSVGYGTIEDNGPRARMLTLWTACPLTELSRLLNVANRIALVRQGHTAQRWLVDVHATALVYREATKRAYRRIGRPYGSSVVEYRDSWAREAAARKARQVEALVGVQGYRYSSDEGAVAAILVDSVGLFAREVARGNIVGGAVMLGIRAIGALFAYLTMGDPPRDPSTYPFAWEWGARLPYNPTYGGVLDTPPGEVRL